ncbi:sigma-K factor-processing regulatory protein bofA [Candidatus Mancarchaeum acidiphilum]|uniref:Sigma-K factor-processing regulatory protein bofA n=1 Tax=Candidatus Mancarchaeum acidiphilum TaxID=1920749 RepID=A0A218NMY9_9ARCH|nr:pro-sigmaK processing inhibitor BofA family protein [Candidatus Mancarchaeum acidiphilum]ASI13839.1 sigma-K factor-processing regulatory protein bofA [Candidatus Mancarchaeum acidiphilum]
MLIEMIVLYGIIVFAIIFGLYLLFKLGGIILGLIANTIMGLASIFIVNFFFGLGIAINLLTIVLVAIFGLPAAAIIIILKIIGISI